MQYSLISMLLSAHVLFKFSVQNTGTVQILLNHFGVGGGRGPGGGGQAEGLELVTIYKKRGV